MILHRPAALVAAGAMAFALAGPAAGQEAAAPASLVVADPAAAHVYVYSVPGFALAADFDNIVLGSHAGTIPLPDGRLLFGDEKSKQLVVLEMKADASPQIAARVPMPIPLSNIYAWTAIDPAAKYFLAVSDDHDAAVELLTIVDLADYSARQFRVDAGSADGELGLAVGGDPALVFFHLSDRVDVYRLADLTADGARLNSLLDGAIKPVGSFPVGDGGHSDSFSVAAGIYAGSTLRGLEVAPVEGAAVGEAAVLPWEADGRSGGRNARQRLTTDGQYVFGPLNQGPAPEQWAEAQNDLHWARLDDGSVRRTPLAPGIVGRGGVSKTLAVYANVHPDGDFANLVDVDPGSASFREVVARVPLDRLAAAPLPGQSPAGREARFAAITPDGSLAFVTHGGDGLVSVIDTASRTVTATIATPTPLKGGGYAVAVQPGTPLFEYSGR